ncbi:hypothetical protein [Herbaspirillum sp. ST 5-3]|uniref:hypothetical protein n=1 Tax=Oxalobacteraceae TaxID=75682 RepID=UPI0010A3870F|nr:hypothetical protein [Herbaspirillum sp. ST 5-3]
MKRFFTCIFLFLCVPVTAEELYRQEFGNYFDQAGVQQKATFKEIVRDETSSVVEVTPTAGEREVSIIPLGKGVCGLMIVREKKFARTYVIDKKAGLFRVAFPEDASGANDAKRDSLEWFFTRTSCTGFAF